MSSQKLRMLSNTLYQTQREHTDSKRYSIGKTKIHTQRQSSKQRYQQLTNRSKDQQKSLVNDVKRKTRSEWKHDYYKINNTFNLFQKKDFQPFPHNNHKYNTQFLQKNLRGRSLKFPAKDWGYFQRPQDKLYSEHYKPIVKGKRKYNQDYQLRTSLFGQTWVDKKRDHIMDEYLLQANPFRTPMSNTLISKMHKDKTNFRLL